MQVFSTTKILSECVAVFLLALMVRLVLSSKTLNSALAGLFYGLLLLIKSYFLIAVPFIIIYYYFGFGKKRFQRMLKICCFLIPLLFVISVVTIRNYCVGKEFVLVSANGGENFYIGAHENATGTYVPVKGISSDIAYQNADVIALAQNESGKKLSRSEVSKYWFDKGLHFITANPLKYLSIEWTKFKNIFSGAELVNMYAMNFEKKNLTHSLVLPFVNFYLLFPLFCAGVLVAFKEWKKYYLALIMLLTNMMSMLIFFYDTRFMVVTMTFFIILSGTGLWNVIVLFRHSGSIKNVFNKFLIIALAAGIGLVAIIYMRDRHFSSQDWRLWTSLGDIYYGLDDYDKSIDNYVKASELNKHNCLPAFGVSKALFKKGNRDIALRLYNSTFAMVNQDYKTTIERDSDFDALRAYAREKQQNALINK